MQSFPYTEHYTDTHTVFNQILKIVTKIYNKCVPDKIKKRKNIAKLIQSDRVIIACVLWGIMLGYTSQRDTYRAVRTILSFTEFPSRTRYTRLCANLVYAIKIIRFFFMKQKTKHITTAIVDSFPSPFCKEIRNRRAKVLCSIAEIDYNSTKEMYYYGVKISAAVTETGFPFAYVVSSPKIHDVQLLETLVNEAPIPHILGDKGYISGSIQDKLAQKGVTVTTPLRKNMKNADKIDYILLGKRRKKIETVFSSLEKLGIQNFRSRSLLGFESRLESLLLVYCLMLDKARERFGNTLKYSLGCF
ncbi:IS982 family transposase [Bacillus cereus]|uniref:IS982 family transposase n=1 Tax=Bacillus cereus TaxID=1396 RepID=UPI0018F38168|nr:IS982 family transposase [Bacillus cereus]MBJ8025733.1 IS982 family transposase [Bacillus cereus]MBJ8038084.1 IS982 family transposase [Bacillus cereus]